MCLFGDPFIIANHMTFFCGYPPGSYMRLQSSSVPFHVWFLIYKKVIVYKDTIQRLINICIKHEVTLTRKEKMQQVI